MKILAGARKSPLSRAQVAEIESELEMRLEPYWVDTVGDRDKKTSLRTLDKTDFFTRDIDELLLAGKIRVGIHSAKDLPDPIREGLEIAAITKGIDSRDSLVIKPLLYCGRDETLNFCGHHSTTNLNDRSIHTAAPRIATSSERREETVRALYPNAIFSDLRGTIQERLQLIEEGIVDGIVVAEAALIRLGLTHLHRIVLSGETVPLQGKLAVLIRAKDQEMRALFRGIDDRPLPRD